VILPTATIRASAALRGTWSPPLVGDQGVARDAHPPGKRGLAQLEAPPERGDALPDHLSVSRGPGSRRARSRPRRHRRSHPPAVREQFAGRDSRRSLDLLRHPGRPWLRSVRCPIAQAVLDGEFCGETGPDGVQSVLEARGRRDRVACFIAFR
jgi:hypothetical protein